MPSWLPRDRQRQFARAVRVLLPRPDRCPRSYKAGSAPRLRQAARHSHLVSPPPAQPTEDIGRPTDGVRTVSGLATQRIRSSEKDRSCLRFPRRDVHAATICREKCNIVRSVCCFVTRSRRAAIFRRTPNLFASTDDRRELSRDARLLLALRIRHCLV